jgi:hypothetical protein
LQAGILRRLAALVRSTPDARLQQLMRTPARRVIIGGICWQLPQQLPRNWPDGVEVSIELRVTTPALQAPDTYSLVITQHRSRVTRGAGAAPPHITITVDATEFVRLATGNANPVRSYIDGKLKLSGDVMLAIRLVGMLQLQTAWP